MVRVITMAWTDLSRWVECARVNGVWEVRPEVRRSVLNAEINRELMTLKRMYSLASDQITHQPKISRKEGTMLKESAARSGFFDREQFGIVLAQLPESLRLALEFAYITGWRIPSEVLPLQWRQIDFAAVEIRLDAGTTKNSEARTFPFTARLRELLQEQRAVTKALERKTGQIIPHLFHRDGAAIRSLVKAFKAASRAAGFPGRIPHDLRRSAVRNLVRAGVSETVAMKLTGHKTRSVFDRYDITSDTDKREAVRRLDAAFNVSVPWQTAINS